MMTITKQKMPKHLQSMNVFLISWTEWNAHSTTHSNCYAMRMSWLDRISFSTRIHMCALFSVRLVVANIYTYTHTSNESSVTTHIACHGWHIFLIASFHNRPTNYWKHFWLAICRHEMTLQSICLVCRLHRKFCKMSNRKRLFDGNENVNRTVIFQIEQFPWRNVSSGLSSISFFLSLYVFCIFNRK